MKTILLTLLLIVGLPALSQNVTVLQINAKWNEGNTRNDLKKLRGCKYEFGYLEDQPKTVSASINSVPTVVVFKNGKPVKVYRADLSLKLGVPFKEIQEEIDRLNQ